MKTRSLSLLAGLALSTLLTATAGAAEWEGKAKDAWIDGKLETSYLLNTELNNFRITTEVSDGDVTLTGIVKTQTHKMLAGEIARNLDGVGRVDNQLSIGEPDNTVAESAKNFRTSFYDLTTSVTLKSKFALNTEIKGSDISVDTENGVVTLDGHVGSEAEKLLAEEIASGHDYVVRVVNQLNISDENA